MLSIDYSDPHQVFNRLAQIQHDTTKRMRIIEAMTNAQTLADQEFDKLERVALAYLAPKDYPVVTATAYEEQHFVRQSIDYCLTIVNSSVVMKPHLSVCDFGNLTDQEITAALESSE